jgi:hypothetical protein
MATYYATYHHIDQRLAAETQTTLENIASTYLFDSALSSGSLSTADTRGVV